MAYDITDLGEGEQGAELQQDMTFGLVTLMMGK